MLKYMALCKLMLIALVFQDSAATKSLIDDHTSANIAMEQLGDSDLADVGDYDTRRVSLLSSDSCNLPATC